MNTVATRNRIDSIRNPYWEAFMKVGSRTSADTRKDIVSMYALAVTSPVALAAIVKFAPPQGLVEIGAGTGYWKFCLEQCGVAVQAFDTAPVEKASNRYFTRTTRQWSPVEVGQPEAARDHRERALFLCWPPHDSTMSEQALNCYGGNRVVYIGETSGKRTGNSRFRARLSRHWRLERQVTIPRWDVHADVLCLYKRA